MCNNDSKPSGRFLAFLSFSATRIDSCRLISIIIVRVCVLNVKPSHSGDHCRGGCGELGRIGVENASFTKLVSTSFHLSPRMSKAQGCGLFDSYFYI